MLLKKIPAAFFFMFAMMLVTVNVTDAAEWEGYKDVTEENVHYEAIKSLTEQDVLTGYLDNTFKPWGSLDREHAAVILYRLGDFETPEDIEASLEKYNDVDSTDTYAKEIAALTEADVFKGDKQGNFNPGKDITREQMASVLVAALKLDELDQEETEMNLDQVDAAHKQSVQVLANLKLTDALENFRPRERISRAAVASLIYRTQQVEEDGFELSVMHFNDSHAHVEKMPHMISAIKQVREQKPDSLLLNAGDVFSGTLYFNEFEGQADLAMMNLMGIDAMTFGNHEFDLGDQEGGHEALAQFVEKAKFPLVSTNVDFSNDDLFTDLISETPYSEDPKDGEIYERIVKEVDGEKVGIFGLTTEDTVSIASPVDVTFSDYKQAAEDAVADFEAEGIDKIIAITHIGYDSDPSVGNDLLLGQVDGIDLIVGGHSHTELPEPVVVDEDADGNKKDPTVIVQAFQYAEFLGTVDVTFDEDGVITGYDGELLDLSAEDDDGNEVYPADEEAVSELAPYKEKIDQIMGEETKATAVHDLANPRQESSGKGDSVRANETPLGNLITDGMLKQAKNYNEDTVIAMQNGGGIRTSIAKGPVAVGEIMEVLPFGNTLAVVKMTPAEIKDVLEHSVKNAPGESGGFLHVSGMKFTYDSSKEPGSRVQDMQLKDGDTFVDFDDDKTYVIATNAFTAKGGDGFDTFAELYEAGKVQDLGLSDWENLKEHMEDLGEVDPQIEDRIVDIAK